MAEQTLPPNWTQHQSTSHSEKIYYFNNATGETSWTVPKNKSRRQKRKQSRGQTLLDVKDDSEVPIQKVKTPAQSRLNTLQKQLLDKQKSEENRIKMKNKKVQKVDTSMGKAKNSKQKTEAGPSEKSQVANAKVVKSLKNGKMGPAGTSQQVLKPGTSSVDAKEVEKKSLKDDPIMKERAKVTSLFAVAENIRNRAMLREQAKAASKRKGKNAKEPPKKEEKPKATENQEPKVVEKQEKKSKIARKRTKCAKTTVENNKCETIVRPTPVPSEKPKDLPNTAQKIDKNFKIGKVATTITEVPLISTQDRGLPSLARPGIKRRSETNKIETNQVGTVTKNRNIKRNNGCSQVLDVSFAGNWIQEGKTPLGSKENQANESRVKEDLDDGAPKCKIKKAIPLEDSSSLTLFERKRDSPFSQVFRSNGVNGREMKDEPLVFSFNKEPEVVKPNSTFPYNNIGAFNTFRLDQDSKISDLSSNAFNRLWTNNQTSIFSSNKEPDVASKSDTIPKASIGPFSSTNIHNFTSGSKPFSANERLANIRRKLALSQNAVKPHNISFSSFFNCSTASSSNDDVTPMEWEDIDPDDEMLPVTRNQNVISIPMENGTPLIEEFPRFSDFYDTVKKNLLKLSSEASSETKEINEEDIFLVIDTNVFVHHLNFLKNLIEKSFVKPNIISVVPYSVLQELDKLKHRTDESLSTLAIRAIKFLNQHFESKNSSVRGQSALDSKMHLIDVESADDSIINCCLQFKRKTANVVLVSNDRNLRNKAICNGISTCTQENLLSRENNNFKTS